VSASGPHLKASRTCEVLQLRGDGEPVAVQWWEVNLLHMQFRTSGERERQREEGARETDLRTRITAKFRETETETETGKPINSVGSSKASTLLHCSYSSHKL
jgi:hypothetical protein